MKTNRKILLLVDKTRLEEIANYINEHFTDELSVQFLTKKFMLTPSTLQRQFKLYFGQTVMQYLHKYRMIQAMKLVTGRNIPLTEIGMSVGYNHRSPFTHAFKKFFGNPPVYYLKNACD